MRSVRLKQVVRNVVEKNHGRPRPFVGLEDVGSGSGALLTTDLAIRSAEDSLIHKPGDVLFGKLRPYLAKSFLATVEGTATGEMLVLRPTTEIDSRFLLYLTLSAPWLEWANTTSYGTKMPRTSWELLRDLRIWLPPMDVQRRIADFLDFETARIDQLRRLGMRQAELLYEHFLETIRSETSGTGDGRPTCETGLPWMPKVSSDWALGKVSHHFRTGSGSTPNSNNEQYYGGPHPWVITGDIRNGPIRTTQKTITDKAVMDNTALKRHKKGALIVAMYGQGDTKGNVGLLEIDAYVNQACCALTPVGRITSQFAYYWFRGHKPGIVQLALGAGQPNLSQELIRQLRLPMPDKGLQEAIVKELAEAELAVSARMSLLEARNKLLLERRQALITAAVTGQFDVGREMRHQ